MLTTGNQVVAKVTVQYNSWKVTYETDSNGYDVATLGSSPGKVTGVLAEKVLSNSSIDISWNAPNNEQGLQYELVWNNGIGDRSNAQYTPLTQPYTFALRYNRGSLVPGRNYLFKVRAINACGAGDWSDVAVQSIHQAPQQPSRPTVNAQVQDDKCGVEISWTAVADGGSPITAFYINIENDIGYDPAAYDGNVDTSTCGYDVLEERMCFILCTTLNDLFGIAIDGNVVATVMAENSVGKSAWSASSTDVVAVTLPPNQMDRPRRISTSGDSITITWAALDDADTNGNEVSSYKIAYQECSDNTLTDCQEWEYSADSTACGAGVAGANLMVSCDQYQSLYDISGLTSNKFYNIKIAARNSCGIGEYSDVLSDNTMNCPQKVEGAVTEIDGANVNIIWDAQDNVSSYEILFKKKDGSWLPIDECDGDPDNVNADDKPYCTLLNSLIKSETELDDQDTIIVKIRAKNINCTGPWSDENTGEAKIAACPVKMEPVFVVNDQEDIRKDSITISWTPLSGEDAGGEGVEITFYEIEYQQLDDNDASISTGTTKVEGDKTTWTHEPLSNAQKW
jgi:hypothetical protein